MKLDVTMTLTSADLSLLRDFTQELPALGGGPSLVLTTVASHRRYTP